MATAMVLLTTDGGVAGEPAPNLPLGSVYHDALSTTNTSNPVPTLSTTTLSAVPQASGPPGLNAAALPQLFPAAPQSRAAALCKVPPELGLAETTTTTGPYANFAPVLVGPSLGGGSNMFTPLSPSRTRLITPPGASSPGSARIPAAPTRPEGLLGAPPLLGAGLGLSHGTGICPPGASGQGGVPSIFKTTEFVFYKDASHAAIGGPIPEDAVDCTPPHQASLEHLAWAPPHGGVGRGGPPVPPPPPEARVPSFLRDDSRSMSEVFPEQHPMFVADMAPLQPLAGGDGGYPVPAQCGSATVPGPGQPSLSSLDRGGNGNGNATGLEHKLQELLDSQRNFRSELQEVRMQVSSNVSNLEALRQGSQPPSPSMYLERTQDQAAHHSSPAHFDAAGVAPGLPPQQQLPSQGPPLRESSGAVSPGAAGARSVAFRRELPVPRAAPEDDGADDELPLPPAGLGYSLDSGNALATFKGRVAQASKMFWR